MASELFTHLGIACTCYYQPAECGGPDNQAELVMNPGGPKSGVGTPHSVSQFISIDTDKLLEVAAQEGFGKRNKMPSKHWYVVKSVG
jgi:hypothetical protein